MRKRLIARIGRTRERLALGCRWQASKAALKATILARQAAPAQPPFCHKSRFLSRANADGPGVCDNAEVPVEVESTCSH
jgi:hypothetical protein